MKKIIGITLSLVILVLICVATVIKPTAEQPVQPLSVRAKRGDVSRSIRLSGHVKPLRTVPVKASVSGVLRRYLAEPGQAVRAGQPIALIDPDPAIARNLEQERMTVSDRDIEANLRRREADRVESLYRSGLVPKRDWEVARDTYRMAVNHAALSKRQLAISERQAQQARGRSDADFRVLSPIGGTFLSGNLEVGETLIAGINGFSQGGTVVAKVADLSRFSVRLEVGEADILEVKAGMRAEIIPAGNREKKYTGLVTAKSLDGSSTQSITTYAVDVLVEPGAGLIPEMSCDVNLLVDERRNVVMLPSLALVKNDRGTFVRRMGVDGKEHFVRVQLGLVGDERSEIVSGVAAGDTILIPTAAPADKGTEKR